MFNSSDEQLIKDFTLPQIVLIEEMCMKAIKDSLDLQMVPIRKFLILFQIYLRCLFGKEVKQGDIKSYGCQHFKNLKHLKEQADKLVSEDEPPRFYQKSNSPVEQFYKRNMSSDHPIPQVIVVGILRVLLTTCPNNNTQKPGNGGGIDLHCEWTSCIELLNT